MKRLILSAALAASLAVPFSAGPAAAQDTSEDEGFITRTIQNSLSGAGRTVDIQGFEGALSSRATLDRLTIADDEGIWLELTDAVLDWNRSALLRGRVEINELTAGSITLTRLPQAEEGAPEPEASGFSIPELPVAVNIGAIRADTVTLGETVIGEPVVLSLSGSAALADGGADVDLDITRTDKAGRFRLDAEYAPGTQALAVDLSLSEPQDGIAARLLDLPGRPSVDLTVAGTGPLDDYRADIDLDTDGEDRLSGAVTLNATGEGRRFTVDLGGDVTALLAPDTREFFGPDIGLQAAGVQGNDGSLVLETFDLTSAALNLSGSAAIGADGQPQRFDVQGTLAPEAGSRVTLPFGEGISVARSDLAVTFDAAESDALTGRFTISEPQMPGYAAEALTLNVDGSITLGETPVVGADVTFAATGVETEDPALQQALGDSVDGGARIDWTQGAPLEIRGLRLEGETYAARLDADIVRNSGSATIRAEGTAEARDLSAFAPLTGTQLQGAANLALDVNADLLGGTFRLVAEGATEGLALGIEQVDPLIGPPATLRIDARRTTDGLTISEFLIENAELNASARGSLANESGRIDYEANLRNSGIFTGTESGPVTLDGTLEMTPDGLEVTGEGRGTELRTGIEQVDALLAGSAQLSYDLLAGERILLRSATVSTTEANISASGELTEGARALDISALLENSAIFTGGDKGAVQLDAKVRQDGSDYLITATGGGTDIGIGNDTVDPLFAGRTTLQVDLRAGERIILNDARVSSPQASVTASGELTPGQIAVDVLARLANSAMFTGGTAGPIEIDADIRQDGEAWEVDATGGGTDIGIGNPTVDPLFRGRTDLSVSLRAGEEVIVRDLRIDNPQARLEAAGNLTAGQRSVTASGTLKNTAIFTGGTAGPLDFTARASQEAEDAYVFELDGTGNGIGIGNPAVDDLLPGTSRITVRGGLQGQTVRLSTFEFDGVAIDASASGTVAAEAIDLTLNARLDDVGRLTDALSGPLTVEGDVGREGDTTRLDVRATGPGGATATVAGRVGLPGGAVALEIDGQAPLALADAFIAPQSIVGLATFDLTVDGQPGLQAVSGRISTSGARVVLPEAQQILDNVNATITLGGGQANVDASAGLGEGTITLGGPVALSSPFNANIQGNLSNIRVERAGLFTTVLNGPVSVEGPLAGNGIINGQITLRDTEVRIPSGSLGGLEAIPDITHVGESAASRRTRARAGLLGDGADTDGSTASGGGSGGLRFGRFLIYTEESIFVRGRGLDAELEGRLFLEGTTSDIRPVGQFDLVRGRLNLLTKRLDLSDGSIRLAGSFEPTIRLVATNQGEEYTIQVVIEGPAAEPSVSFVSQPELPEDEVLAQLFFERDLQSLSVLQAAQLAAAVAELTGRGDGGVVGRLRENFGLDDLDVSQTADGETSVRAGKYLSENVYTDVEVLSSGETNLSINLDVTDHLTAKGKTSSSGDASIGLFFEKDY